MKASFPLWIFIFPSGFSKENPVRGVNAAAYTQTLLVSSSTTWLSVTVRGTALTVPPSRITRIPVYRKRKTLHTVGNGLDRFTICSKEYWRGTTGRNGQDRSLRYIDLANIRILQTKPPSGIHLQISVLHIQTAIQHPFTNIRFAQTSNATHCRERS